MAACLLLGGATTSGHLSDAILQFVSIPLLVAAIWCLDLSTARQVRAPLLLCFAAVLLPLLQLVPLPPQIWSALPGREPVVETFRLLGQDLPWRPLSVSPQATWLSLLSLLPPVAVFVATLQLGYRDRRIVSLVTIAVGLAGALVGLAQVIQGESSPLRLFEITNPSEAVGFFANRNHFASLLYVLILLVAAWLVRTAEFGPGLGQHDTPRTLLLAGAIVVLVFLVAVQAIARSRAGIVLTIVAFLAAVVLAFSERGAAANRTPAQYLMGVLALAAVFAVQYGLYRFLGRFTDDSLAGGRVQLAGTTYVAAKAFFPLGSGLGTFVPVYAMFEKPEGALRDAFANRAHNDFVELWLEAGVPAALLAVAFAAWFSSRAIKAWRTSSDKADSIDRLLARAATIIVVLIAAHSFVDYPLRTSAVLAVLALSLGLLCAPPTMTEDRKQEPLVREPPEAVPAAPPARAALPARERWGEEMNWPDAWRRRDK